MNSVVRTATAFAVLMHALLGCCFHHDACCAADVQGHADCGVHVHGEHENLEAGQHCCETAAVAELESAKPPSCCSGHQNEVSSIAQDTVPQPATSGSGERKPLAQHARVHSLECHDVPHNAPHHCDGAHCVSLVETSLGESALLLHDSGVCTVADRIHFSVESYSRVDRAIALALFTATGPQALYCRWQI